MIAVVLAKRLARDKNKVVLASRGTSGLNVKSHNVAIHSVNPADPIFRDVLSSYKFDVVIFLSTREEMFEDEKEGVYLGQQLDGLRNALELSKNGTKRFLYISSTEVYGETLNLSEISEPQPGSINGHTIYAGEKYCRLYQNEFDLNILILRLPYVYGPEEMGGALFRLITEGVLTGKVRFPGSSETSCGFLHVDDVVTFLKQIVDEEEYSKYLVVDLNSSKPLMFSELSLKFNEYLPESTISYDDSNQLFTRNISSSRVLEDSRWQETRHLNDDLQGLIEKYIEELGSKPSVFSQIANFLSRGKGLLKWGELVLGAVLAFYFSRLTNTLIQFQYVDFRLLYVVIMGSIYGFQFGLYSSVLMGIFLVYTWIELGVSWELLVYNVGNWFPLVMYLSAGLITGYNHDKNENSLVNGQKQYNLILEKYSFLFEVFNEVRDLKDEFRERLIGYRDSFGKIFTITQELDELQEHAVYFRALNILEELMSNKNIAIYSLDSVRSYARLEVSSPDMKLETGLKKSMRLSDYPVLLNCVEEGKIFQNTKLLEDYPAYAAPVFNNSYPFNVPVAIVVIWRVDFDQFSTYYLNLFKVICGLIEASLVRATLFLDANFSKVYLPSTRILNRDAFLDLLKIRVKLKKNGVSDFQLIKLMGDVNSIQEKYAEISMGIRSVDIVGALGDGTCCILLSQADTQASLDVLSRLDKMGVKGDLLEVGEIVLE